MQMNVCADTCRDSSHITMRSIMFESNDLKQGDEGLLDIQDSILDGKRFHEYTEQDWVPFAKANQLNLCNIEFLNTEDLTALLKHLSPQLKTFTLRCADIAEGFQFPPLPQVEFLSLQFQLQSTESLVSLFTACSNMKTLAWGGNCLFDVDAAKQLVTVAPKLAEFIYNFGEQHICAAIDIIGPQLKIFRAPDENISSNIIDPFIKGKLELLQCQWFQIGVNALLTMPHVKFVIETITVCFMPSFVRGDWNDAKITFVKKMLQEKCSVGESNFRFKRCSVNAEYIEKFTMEAFEAARRLGLEKTK